MLKECPGALVNKTIFFIVNYNKEDLLGKKIEGLHESSRFDDVGIIKFQGGLKIGGFGVIT